MVKKYYVIFLLLFFKVLFLSSQTLEEAKELYKIGEFSRALPVFEKEYNEKPTDASLNQWYGVCLFETGKDMAKAEEYISFAAKKNVQEAFLYLGKIYAKTYRFKEAQKEFDQYAKLKRRDKDALVKLEEERNYLSHLKRAVSRTEDVQIIDSLVLDKNDFLEAYRLSASAGSISYYNEFFTLSGTSNSTVYLNEKKDKIYFAKPVSGELSLFSMEKLLDEFGNEKRLSEENFEFSGSLNYPFLMADGVTIYFAAQDVDGYGDYDIYVTRYNLNNDTYLTPERLNMPFNSSFNDYLLVVDEEKGIGWFASDRFQPEGKVCVYTFIPNASVDILESEDDNYLASRARINSIKDSWKTGIDYRSKIALARKEIEEQPEDNRDFMFVINDKLIYYSYTDFKNQTAKNLYNQVIEKKNTLASANNKLKGLRDSYRSSPNNTSAKEILELENRILRLHEEIESMEILARNQEISFLNK